MKKTTILLSSLVLLINGNSFAANNHVSAKNEQRHSVNRLSGKWENAEMDASSAVFSDKNEYLPHLQIGGNKFFNVDHSSWASSVDLFMPLWQPQGSHLIFTQARIFDRSAKPFEGNLHLGYRYLSEDRSRLHGVYGSLDRSRSYHGNYYNQLTFGLENWFQQLFIGANYYLPIGVKNRNMNIAGSCEGNYHRERAAHGFDGDVGYEFIPGLVGYVGGYYFKSKDLKRIRGPKAKVVYDYSLGAGRKILGVFNKLGLEAGIRDDRRGTAGYIGANFRLDLLPGKESSSFKGVAHHMVDLVHREFNMVVAEDRVEQKCAAGTPSLPEPGSKPKLPSGADGSGTDEKNQVVTNEDTAKKATEQEDKPQTKRREDVQDKPPQPSDPKVIAQEDSKQEMQQTKSIQAEENTDTKTMTTEKIIKSEAAKEDNTKLKATEHKPELEVLPNSSN